MWDTGYIASRDSKLIIRSSLLVWSLVSNCNLSLCSMVVSVNAWNDVQTHIASLVNGHFTQMTQDRSLLWLKLLTSCTMYEAFNEISQKTCGYYTATLHSRLMRPFELYAIITPTYSTHVRCYMPSEW